MTQGYSGTQVIQSPCPSLHNGVSFPLLSAAENLRVCAGRRRHGAEPSLGSDGTARVTFRMCLTEISHFNCHPFLTSSR